jgi:hypothetical protein
MFHRVVLCLVVALVGCADRSQVAALEKRTAELEAEVVTLKATAEKNATDFDGRMNDFGNSIQSLTDRQTSTEWAQSAFTSAYLTPGSDGYQIVQTDLARLTVSLEDVKPYASGARVKVQFGNPTSSTIDGLHATVDWGSVDEKGLPKPDTTKSREVSFNESLRPGTWSTVSLVLDGTPPGALGYIRVRDVGERGIHLMAYSNAHH